MSAPPPERRRSPRPARRMARNPALEYQGPVPRRSPRMVTATAVGVLALALFGFFLVTQLARTRGDSPDTTRYTVGNAERLAELVEADGPLLFQDVSSGERDLFVQHLGDGRWTAFQAYVPGSGRSCQLEWQPTDAEFLDPCTEETYPADGAGLPTWPAEVDEEGRLILDLRSQSPAPG